MKAIFVAPMAALMCVALASCQPKPKSGLGGIAPPTDRDTTVTVAQVLNSPALVGWRVKVTGRCLGYGTPKAVGTPPLTRSDWQMEDGAAAIWVSGPLPPGCSVTEGSTTSSTIQAVVYQDTISMKSAPEVKTRRYLVRR